MAQVYLNPFLFFFINDGHIIAWDYKNHQQFELEKLYFERLCAISQGENSHNPIDEELLDSKLISYSAHNIEWGWDILSKIFHIGTQNIPLAHDIYNAKQHIEAYMEFCQKALSTTPDKFIEKSGPKFNLPEPNISLLSKQDFWSVLKQRKTSRSFNQEAIPSSVISTLLYAVFGNIHADWSDIIEFGLSDISYRKSSPSAGGLHPSEAYLLALNVEDIEPGVYHYEGHTHTLTLINKYDGTSKLGPLLAGQSFAEDLSAGVFITSRMEKSWHKYRHSKGYSHLLIDIGHLSQTFQLCATAMGYKPWLTSAFCDDAISTLLKLDNSTEYPMFFVGIGQGDGHSLSREMREFLCNQAT